MTPKMLINDLAARAVEVIILHNRIRTKPPDAYKALTDDELVCWHRHRDEIKRLIIGGYQSAAEPKPEPQDMSEPQAENAEPLTPTGYRPINFESSSSPLLRQMVESHRRSYERDFGH